MCGILGMVVNEMHDEVVKNLFELFFQQKERGSQGAGITIKNGNTLYRFRSHSPYRLFASYNNAIWRQIRKGSRVIIHHRFPTSTINKPMHNHPLASEDNSIHMIHNGVVTNDLELKSKLHNHKFESEENGKFTDSEVMLHLIEESEGNFAERIGQMFDKAEGYSAIAVLSKDEKNIYLANFGNPIVVSTDDKNNFYFSSLFSESLEDCGLKKILSLSDGEIGELSDAGFHSLLKKKIKKVKWKQKYTSDPYSDWDNGKFTYPAKGGYDYYFPKKNRNKHNWHWW